MMHEWFTDAKLGIFLHWGWGYQKQDRNFKSVRQCVRMLAECAGMGGNLLLDVGPKNDGTILPEQVDVLRGLGRWTKKHAEGIYGSVAGLPHGHFYGASTLNKSHDTLYLILFDRRYDAVAVKGIRNPIRKATVLSNAPGSPGLKHRKNRRRPLGRVAGLVVDRRPRIRPRSRCDRDQAGTGWQAGFVHRRRRCGDVQLRSLHRACCGYRLSRLLHKAAAIGGGSALNRSATFAMLKWSQKVSVESAAD